MFALKVSDGGLEYNRLIHSAACSFSDSCGLLFADLFVQSLSPKIFSPRCVHVSEETAECHSLSTLTPEANHLQGVKWAYSLTQMG